MLRIGGENGHVKESVDEPVFIAVYNTFRWKMIKNFTGRFTCRDHGIVSQMTPLQLIINSLVVNDAKTNSLKQYYYTFEDQSKNPMIVIPFTEEHQTGLITYVKESVVEDNCQYVHTLNAPSGFQRKLEAMKVYLCDENKI
mmetsp:Transcript_7162/g.13603  ORF Transcript_7162/g.13603 Transcript_7162/m.13603 type:complete len:141 (+) Transcript_7162:122-544(+)